MATPTFSKINFSLYKKQVLSYKWGRIMKNVGPQLPKFMNRL